MEFRSADCIKFFLLVRLLDGEYMQFCDLGFFPSSNVISVASIITLTSDLINCGSKRGNVKYSRAHADDGSKGAGIQLGSSSSTAHLVPQPYVGSVSGDRYEPLAVRGVSPSRSGHRYNL